MTAEKYLSQARHLEQHIDAKVGQVASLNDLATKCTAVMSGMPHSPNHGTSTMADTVCKIVDLQEEIKRDIEQMLELKKEILAVINSVQEIEYQILLEKRYLCYCTWEQISLDMNYSEKWVRTLHSRALDAVARVLREKYRKVP